MVGRVACALAAQVRSTCRLTALSVYVQLVPCAVVALISHPVTRHAFVNRVLWAFCVYAEAVSVAPQVVMMQHNKTVEKFTGHYVFFLGLSRFFSCAHWVLQMADGRSSALWQVRPLGNVWPLNWCWTRACYEASPASRRALRNIPVSQFAQERGMCSIAAASVAAALRLCQCAPRQLCVLCKK